MAGGQLPGCGASPPLTVTSAAPPGSWGVAGGLLVAGYTRDGTVLGLGHRAAWSLVPRPSPRAGLEESDAAPGIRLTWVTSYGFGPSLTCPVPLGLKPPAHFSTGWCGLRGTATTGQVSPVHHAHSSQEVGCGDPCRVGPSGTGRQGSRCAPLHPQESLCLPTGSLGPGSLEEKGCVSPTGKTWASGGLCLPVASCPASLPAPLP